MNALCVSLLAALLTGGCDASPSPPNAAPSVELTALGVCDGARSVDGLAPFEAKHGAYCIDPHAPPRIYARSDDLNSGHLCTELSQTECAALDHLGMRQVTKLRYVRDDGSPSTVEVLLRRFAAAEGAFAFYTNGVLGPRDPAALQVRQLPGLEFSAIGNGAARVYLEKLVIEAHYSNSQQSPERLEAEADQALAIILKHLGDGNSSRSESLPPSVQRLPTRERLDFGVRFEPRNAFGVEGLGQAAVGYYARGDKRFRVVVSDAQDLHVARDVYHALRRLPGRRLLKDMPFDAFEIRDSSGGGPVNEWLVGKLESAVVAVMDEPLVLPAATSSAQRRVRCLDRAAKLRVLRDALRLPAR